MHLGSLGIFNILLLAPLAHILQRSDDLGKPRRKRQRQPPLRFQEPKNHHKIFKNTKNRLSKAEANYLFAYAVTASAEYTREGKEKRKSLSSQS